MEIAKVIWMKEPLPPEQMEELLQWNGLTDAKVAELKGAIGIPDDVKCQPTIMTVYDADKDVRCVVKDVQIPPFVNDNGFLLGISVHPTERGKARAKIVVRRVD